VLVLVVVQDRQLVVNEVDLLQLLVEQVQGEQGVRPAAAEEEQAVEHRPNPALVGKMKASLRMTMSPKL
jgi:hypothetical protein